MAKKETADLTVEEKLKVLFQLQTTLSAIDEQREIRGELPEEVNDLRDEIEGLNVRIEKIERETGEFSSAIAEKRHDMDEAKQSVARYKAQLDDVKNNREYDALQKEIEFQSLEIELCKKKITEANEEVARRNEELEKNKALREDRRAALAEKENELGEIIEETRAEEERLGKQAEALKEKIDPMLLRSFTRIRDNARNGLGLVYVQRDACGGCFNKIPPQRQLDVKTHKKIIVCEYCGRILIDPELAGVAPAADAADAQKKPVRKRTVTRKKADK